MNNTETNTRTSAQLQKFTKKLAEIEYILQQRLPNQKRFVSAIIASTKWKAKSIWKHDNDKIEAGIRHANFSIRQYCRRIFELAEQLTQLLLDVDLIETDGDITIRRERKGIVLKIQELLLMADEMALLSDKIPHFFEKLFNQHASASNHKQETSIESEYEAQTETSSTVDDFEFVEMPEFEDEDHVKVEASDVSGEAVHVPTVSSLHNKIPTQLQGNAHKLCDGESHHIHADVESKRLGEPRTVLNEVLPSAQGNEPVQSASHDEPKIHQQEKTIYVHYQGKTFVTTAQGNETHIFIDEPNAQRQPIYHPQPPFDEPLPQMYPIYSNSRPAMQCFKPWNHHIPLSATHLNYSVPHHYYRSHDEFGQYYARPQVHHVQPTRGSFSYYW